MAKQTIGLGTVANDGTGDALRDAFDKCNDNFTELYGGAAGIADLAANRLLGNNTGSPAPAAALTAAQVKTLLAIATGDVSGLGTMATQNTGASGSFTTVDMKTVTVVNGIITSIV